MRWAGDAVVLVQAQAQAVEGCSRRQAGRAGLGCWEGDVWLLYRVGVWVWNRSWSSRNSEWVSERGRGISGAVISAGHKQHDQHDQQQQERAAEAQGRGAVGRAWAWAWEEWDSGVEVGTGVEVEVGTAAR